MNPSGGFVQNLRNHLIPQVALTVLSNLRSSLSICDLPCVLYRNYDREFLRQVSALTIIGSIEVERQRELVYLLIHIPESNVSTSPLNHISLWLAFGKS